MEIAVETAVRICPVACNSDMLCVQPNIYNSTIQLGNSQTYPVNHVLPADCCQNTLFTTTVAPLLNYLFEGCDVSVVTIGQPGTGKSYTLLGPGLHCALSESEHGVIPRFLREVFSKVNENRERNCSIHITWSQICGENVQDLLGTGSIECTNVSDAFQLIQLGMLNIAPKCAHTLFTITLEQQWVSDSTVQHRISTASFTDLAGCEKILVMDNNGLTQSIPADSGLLALQRCILSLTEPYINVVPYNQSVLTTLLKDSFGGRAKTVVICCLSPLLRDFSETYYTLQFALRAQMVKNIVTINSFTTFDSNANDNSDIFELQFAANQLSKLVSNAEELFQKLVANGQLTKNEVEQISRWLTLKQECEECLSESSEPRRSLERIEEEIEDSSESSDNEIPEEETESLLDRLEVLMQSFRIKTDNLVAKSNTISKSSVNNSIKETEISNELNRYQKQINELLETIQIKESLLQKLMKHKDVKMSARDKIEQKCKKLKNEYNSVNGTLAQAQAQNNQPLNQNCQVEIAEIEQKLKDAESIRNMTEDGIRKIMELESSLHTSYKQLEKLKKYKRKEEKRLLSLKSQLKHEKKKLIHSPELIKTKTAESISQVDSEDLQALVLHKNCDTDSSISIADNENLDCLRHEIRELRKHREQLLEQRCKLDAKSSSRKILNEEEDDIKLLQYEEAIEAIDLAIEYKNGLICGHLPITERSFDADLNVLIEIVMKLNENEMRLLLQHYYEKIINLRCSSKKLEMQLMEIECQNENQACRIQNLSHTLQQVRLEAERRIVSLQQQHEDKLHLLLRHLADDGGEDGVVSRVLETSKQAAVALQVGPSKQVDKSNLIARYTRYTHHTVPRQLQGVAQAPQAKVTRQKNKLIIQQSSK